MRNKSKAPNLFIVGAAKSGTTFLYHYLDEHPEVYMANLKEPSYLAFRDKPVFNRDPRKWQISIKDDAEYLKLFSKGISVKYRGEGSTVYLYRSKESIQAMKALAGESKIVIVLRHPVKRAFSSFQHVLRDGEKLSGSFMEALHLEGQRISEDFALRWRFFDAGFYYESVKNYLDAFGCENVKVFIFEEMVQELDNTYKELCEFLEIEEYQAQNNTPKNVSGIFKNLLAKKAYRLIKQPPWFIGFLIRKTPFSHRERFLFYLENNYLRKLILDPKLENHIASLYIEDVRKLENLLERDLKIWQLTSSIE